MLVVGKVIDLKLPNTPSELKMLKVVPTAAGQVHDINRLGVMPWP